MAEAHHVSVHGTAEVRQPKTEKIPLPAHVMSLDKLQRRLEKVRDAVDEVYRKSAQADLIKGTLLINQKEGILTGLELTEDMSPLNMVIRLAEKYADLTDAKGDGA